MRKHQPDAARNDQDINATMDRSILHRLPPELRNQIYALLMPKPQHVTVNLRYRRYKYLEEEDDRTDIYSLARTCKEIHRECMSLYYAANHWNLVVVPF